MRDRIHAANTLPPNARPYTAQEATTRGGCPLRIPLSDPQGGFPKGGAAEVDPWSWIPRARSLPRRWIPGVGSLESDPQSRIPRVGSPGMDPWSRIPGCDIAQATSHKLSGHQLAESHHDCRDVVGIFTE